MSRATEDVIGLPIINVSNLKELMDQNAKREVKFEICDSDISFCPVCTNKTRKVKIRPRPIYHLRDTIIYDIHYYYCDKCHKGLPSIPPNALPNIHCGIDVIAHIAYWHVLRGESYQTLSEHLKDCHNIIQSPATIRLYFERFSILIQQGLSVMDLLIKDWFSDQEVKEALLDESYFSAWLGPKICVATFLLPSVRVIAGINVLEKRNQEAIQNIMIQFREKIGDLDVLTVDMAANYRKPAEAVFTSVSLQYCVFHFFQILSRTIINPFVTDLRQQLKQEIIQTRKACQREFKKKIGRIEKSLRQDLEDLKNRIFYCLRKRNVAVILADIHSLRFELMTRTELISKKGSINFDSRKKFSVVKNRIENILSVLESLEIKIKDNKKVLEAIKQLEIHEQFQNLFNQTNEIEFDLIENQLKQEFENSPFESIKSMGLKYEEYRNNLRTYLDKGIEKTTSLLERVHQSMKKGTKNFRGAHSEGKMNEYMTIYQFFWNVSPFKLPGEKLSEIKSPIERILNDPSKNQAREGSISFSDFLYNLDYFKYRKQVNECKEKIKSRNRTKYEKKSYFNSTKSKSYTEKAKLRWKESKTLASLEYHLQQLLDKPIPEIKPILTKSDFSETNLLVYSILKQYKKGILRSELVKKVKLARTTIYDSLAKLEVHHLVRRVILNSGKPGRPKVLFQPVDPPPDPG